MFQESISIVDEFLLSVHNKIHLVTKDNTIMPSDYFVTFKTQRETGAGTQLVDEQDFIKFKSEYTKLAARKTYHPKLRSKSQPPPSTLQMPLVLLSSLSPQALPLSPDIQPLQQSPQVQLIQPQQSPPQLPQAQLMQPLLPQVQQSQQSPHRVQQSLQAQLIQPQQSLPLSQVQQLPQM
ncbi:19208_t:CDS:2 [Dentiscutata erythropus]|uniref:19208_t:CDS:1 n=1 Tax=Dentiscutata erythropus TaxID=1348616 RepID=A0A9N9FVA4_9GLOM|nr:19208_t:CDS:2 [Dentiscutata erythropus]